MASQLVMKKLNEAFGLSMEQPVLRLGGAPGYVVQRHRTGVLVRKEEFFDTIWKPSAEEGQGGKTPT
jgi:hypothetical protein